MYWLYRMYEFILAANINRDYYFTWKPRIIYAHCLAIKLPLGVSRPVNPSQSTLLASVWGGGPLVSATMTDKISKYFFNASPVLSIMHQCSQRNKWRRMEGLFLSIKEWKWNRGRNKTNGGNEQKKGKNKKNMKLRNEERTNKGKQEKTRMKKQKTNLPQMFILRILSLIGCSRVRRCSCDATMQFYTHSTTSLTYATLPQAC